MVGGLQDVILTVAGRLVKGMALPGSAAVADTADKMDPAGGSDGRGLESIGPGVR